MSTVVLIHGFPLASQMWVHQMAALERAGHTVRVPNLPGFGGTAAPTSQPALRTYADCIMNDLEGEPVVVAGLSMGGYIVMELLRSYRERIDAFALIDTKATADSGDARAHRLRVADAVIASNSVEALVRTMPETLVSPSTSAQILDDVRLQMRTASPQGVAFAQRAMAQRPESLTTLADVDMPALVLWGVDDQISPASEQRLMLEAMPHATWCEVSHAGHMAPMENPDEVSSALVDFLSTYG